VVANPEKNDRAGMRRPREFSGRDKAQHGNDRRSGAPNGFRESRAAAFFQPPAQNGGASDSVMRGDKTNAIYQQTCPSHFSVFL